MIYNITLVADIKHSGSDISDSLYYGLLQNTERSSLAVQAVLQFWLSTLYTVVVVCIC